MANIDAFVSDKDETSSVVIIVGAMWKPFDEEQKVDTGANNIGLELAQEFADAEEDKEELGALLTPPSN